MWPPLLLIVWLDSWNPKTWPPEIMETLLDGEVHWTNRFFKGIVHLIRNIIKGIVHLFRKNIKGIVYLFRKIIKGIVHISIQEHY